MEQKKKSGAGAARLTRAERSERDIPPTISNPIVPYSKLMQEPASPTTKQLNELKNEAKEFKVLQPQHVNSLQSLKQLDLVKSQRLLESLKAKYFVQANKTARK